MRSYLGEEKVNQNIVEKEEKGTKKGSEERDMNTIKNNGQL